jgi:hypothetical protein
MLAENVAAPSTNFQLFPSVNLQKKFKQQQHYIQTLPLSRFNLIYYPGGEKKREQKCTLKNYRENQRGANKNVA